MRRFGSSRSCQEIGFCHMTDYPKFSQVVIPWEAEKYLKKSGKSYLMKVLLQPSSPTADSVFLRWNWRSIKRTRQSQSSDERRTTYKGVVAETSQLEEKGCIELAGGACTLHKIDRVYVLDIVRIVGHPHEILLPPSIGLRRTPWQICCFCVVIHIDKITFRLLI